MHAKSTGNGGFTILEMAIVVFVIGLIIAGITAGKNVLAGAKVRAVITEFEEYEGAVRLFRDKYFDWPGDMSDATEQFSGFTTADGDGNERIVWGDGEGTLAWQHLELAKMIGQTGFSTAMGTLATVGETVPASRIAGAGWFISYTDSNMPNHLGLGVGDGSGINDTGAMVPKRAMEVDVKLDDSKPDTGKIQSDGSGNCRAGTDYDVAEESPACTMRFSLE